MTDVSPDRPGPAQRPLPAAVLPERRYSDEEVRRLLERAAEMQPSAGGAPGAPGLTLRELEEIAKEAGIDPRALRQAAAELNAHGEDEGAGAGRVFAGEPLRIVFERTLPFEASAAGLDGLPPLIEMAVEVPGTTNRGGGSLSWRSDDKVTPRRVRVVVSVRSGSTVVRLEESFGVLTGVSYGVILAPSTGASFGIGAALAHALAIPALLGAVPLGVAVVGGIAIRFLLGAGIRKRRRLLERLLEDIVESLAGSRAEQQLAP